MKQPQEPVGGPSDWRWDVVLLVLLTATAALVLALPAAPTQDGPVHLYYAGVLRGLLLHSGQYAQYFALKKLLTPYALEYFVLVALEAVFSPPWAEKVLLCGYVFAFGLGFQYLLGAVGPRRTPWSLAAVPFAMNLLVYLGFLNYCFGIALLFFLSGYWLRNSGRLTARHVVRLSAGLVLLLLTHPLPEALFLLIIGLELAAGYLLDAIGQRRWKAPLAARLRPLAVLAGFAAVTAAWTVFFLDRSPQQPSPPPYFRTMGWIPAMLVELQMWPAMPFKDGLYRAGPMLLMGVAVLAAVWALVRRRGHAGSAALALLAASGICFLLFCVAPREVNHSWNFPERFPVLWAVFLIAAAAALAPPRPAGQAAGVLAVLTTAGMLAGQWLWLGDLSGAIRSVDELAPVSAGSVGLIVGRPNSDPYLSFDPYMWASAAYFGRSGTMMANAPWMDLSIIMLKPVHPDRFSYHGPAEAVEQLALMSVGGETTPQLDFVVLNQPFEDQMEEVLKRLGFSLAPEDDGFVRVYRRER